MEARPITLTDVFDVGADDVDDFLKEWRERAEYNRTARPPPQAA
jgi:hypothetical protein